MRLAAPFFSQPVSSSTRVLPQSYYLPGGDYYVLLLRPRRLSLFGARKGSSSPLSLYALRSGRTVCDDGGSVAWVSATLLFVRPCRVARLVRIRGVQLLSASSNGRPCPADRASRVFCTTALRLVTARPTPCVRTAAGLFRDRL